MSILKAMNCYKAGKGTDKIDAMKLHDGCNWGRDTVGSIEKANSTDSGVDGTCGGSKRIVINPFYIITGATQPGPYLQALQEENTDGFMSRWTAYFVRNTFPLPGATVCCCW